MNSVFLGEESIAGKRQGAGCTIVSKNYFAFAKTLADSFLRNNAHFDFHILIVDRAEQRRDFVHPGVEVLFLEDLGIPDWLAVAFKFDILELNTNVKPTLLKRLLGRGYPLVYYFDPDIYCYRSTEVLSDALAAGNILLTPHAISPIHGEDDLRPIDRDFLRSGVYNLGFIGVRNTVESLRFLEWWESRCLTQGFAEPSMSLFVDQRWIDLAPCYFSGVVISKHIGCNVAYWNIHERSIAQLAGGGYVVNGPSKSEDLIFYHFSGMDPLNISAVSKHQNRFSLASRPDLRSLFESYAATLLSNGYRKYKQLLYGFATFSNGDHISSLIRRYRGEIGALSEDSDPFQSGSKTYAFAKRNRLIAHPRQVGAAALNSLTVNERGSQKLRCFAYLLRTAQFVLGADRFEIFNKLMRYYSVPNNQARILFKD